MTATVLEIAGMISVKRTPLDGDIEGIVARAKVVLTRTELINVQECTFLDPEYFYTKGTGRALGVKILRVQKRAFLDMN